MASLLLLSTAFFFYPILNTITTAAGLPLPGPVVRIDTNARDQWPDHPFIHAQDKFATRFDSATSVAISVVVKEGTIFTPETRDGARARVEEEADQRSVVHRSTRVFEIQPPTARSRTA